MNDDRIEPTFGSIDTDENKSSSAETSIDNKEPELTLDDDIFKVPSDDNDTFKVPSDDGIKQDNKSTKPEDLSIKITPDRGKRPSIDEELAKPDLFDTSLRTEKPAYKGHESTSFSLFTGRIDRFHASVILVGSSLLSLLLLVYFDAIFYFFIDSTSGTVVENAYQTDPLIYIGISAGLWLISLLIIAMGRLRDIGYSPLFSIFLYAPPLSFIIIFLAILPGTPQSNKYGPAAGAYGLKTWLLAGLFLGLLPLLAYMNWPSFGEYLGEIVKRFNSE